MKLTKAETRDRAIKKKKHGMRSDKRQTDIQNAILKRAKKKGK